MFSKLNIVNNEKTTFEINNKKDLKLSLINGIKRTIYGKIPVYAIDPESINFIINNTTFDNSFLTLRLSLIPIRCDLENIDYDNTLITFKQKNNDSIIKSYYCKDFNIENNNLFAYENTLFTKIKPNEELEFTCKLKKNITLTSNASFCAVSNASYKFKMDNKEIEKKIKESNMNSDQIRSFKTLEAKRIYLKNDDGEPSIYDFTLENCGNYDNKTIMTYGFDILSLQLKDLAQSFNNNDKSKFNIQKANAKMDCFDITILDENDTVGNLLTTYLLNEKNVEYTSYKIPHPLHNKLLLRIKCKNNTIEEIMKIIDKTIKNIVDLLNTMKTEWNKFYKGNSKKNKNIETKVEELENNGEEEPENNGEEESENDGEEEPENDGEEESENDGEEELENDGEEEPENNKADEYNKINEELKNYENDGEEEKPENGEADEYNKIDEELKNYENND